MDKQDLKAIENLLDKKLDQKLEPVKKDLEEIKETQETQTGKILEIERDIKAALEFRRDVSEIREKVDGHEERISQLENP